MMKVLSIFGTRPEAIKMAPVVKKLQNNPGYFETKICLTAQHRQMLDQVVDIFQIHPDYDLNLMKANQDLYDLTANLLLELKKVLFDYHPDLVLVQGDTTTAFVASLAAFYQKTAVGHIEAGLRTGNLYSPWPEELNRQLITRIAGFFFAPTLNARNNLLEEKIPADRILVTGNTVIDALLMMRDHIQNNPVLENELRGKIKESGYEPAAGRRFILITGHRRENFGQGIVNICQALKEIARNNPDCDLVYPAHLNPNVLHPVTGMLSGAGNIYIIKPLEYGSFVYLMSQCYLILTDSGGIQEEAPTMKKPVLVMRDTTERPEAVAAGTAKLVGTDPEKIIAETQILLTDQTVYHQMTKADNPYGDGMASERIVEFLKNVTTDN